MGHVTRVVEKNGAHRGLVRKGEEKRLRGRWEDNIKMDVSW